MKMKKKNAINLALVLATLSFPNPVFSQENDCNAKLDSLAAEASMRAEQVNQIDLAITHFQRNPPPSELATAAYAAWVATYRIALLDVMRWTNTSTISDATREAGRAALIASASKHLDEYDKSGKEEDVIQWYFKNVAAPMVGNAERIAIDLQKLQVDAALQRTMYKSTLESLAAAKQQAQILLTENSTAASALPCKQDETTKNKDNSSSGGGGSGEGQSNGTYGDPYQMPSAVDGGGCRGAYTGTPGEMVFQWVC